MILTKKFSSGYYNKKEGINQVKKKILKITLFAVAFAFVEASVVVYLRHLLGSAEPSIDKHEILLLLPGIAFLEPETAVKIMTSSALLNVERLREASTLVMLAAVASLAGQRLKEKIAFFFLAFGIWDIFYYVFLRLTIGWPKSFSDLDIFFLLPTPWVGPVLVPVAMSSAIVILSVFYIFKSKDK